MKKNFTETYKVSKTFNAPLDFVFHWCTDFREDDGKMTGSKAKRTFLERTEKRIVWAVNYREKGKNREGLRVVWLQPPDAWYLDTCGDGREVGEYKLTPKGRDRTRLDMKFRVSYESKDEVEDKKKWERDASDEWDTFARYLEKDYTSSPQTDKS